MRVGPFAFRYQGNGATPCHYIDTTRKAIDCGRQTDGIAVASTALAMPAFRRAVKMNIHVRGCAQSVHHQHAHVISDGHASIDDVPVKVKTSLHQAFSRVIDVMNLCFIHALLYNTHISKCKVYDDPGPL